MSVRRFAVAVCLSTLSLPAGADPLKGTEILHQLSGDWSYVFPPGYAPDPDFCKFRWTRWSLTAGLFEHRSIHSDKPVNFYRVTTGKVVRVDGDSILIAMDLPPTESPATTKVWMRDQDFAVVEIQTHDRNPPLYLKRCANKELVS